MARPQRNNVDYFPFYCEEGKKMFYIEETYGNDGFAVFIKLLRELARADNHYLDLSKKTTTMFLSAKCKVSNEILNAIINDLVELGKFNKKLWSDNRIIWCQDFIDSIQDAYSKRINKCMTYEGLLLLLKSLGVLKQSKSKPTVGINPQSKEEYTIIEERKEKKTKEKDTDPVKNGPYKKFVEMWFLFYEKKTGLKPKFTAVSGTKIKSIITYLETLSKNKKFTGSELFEQVLNRWSDLSEWEQKNYLDLNVLDQKLPVIINQFKVKSEVNGELYREMEQKYGAGTAQR